MDKIAEHIAATLSEANRRWLIIAPSYRQARYTFRIVESKLGRKRRFKNKDVWNLERLRMPNGSSVIAAPLSSTMLLGLRATAVCLVDYDNIPKDILERTIRPLLVANKSKTVLLESPM